MRRSLLPLLTLVASPRVARAAEASVFVAPMSTSAPLSSALSRAVVAAGGRAVIVERPPPVPRDGELLVRVAYTAINRADTLQRRGKYDPPPGATDVLGLEASGLVIAAGAGCAGRFPVGSRVMALLAGGGNADFVTVREDHVLPIPDGMDLRTAAAVPETWLTAYQLLRLVGRVAASDTVLVHAAGSGVGTAAVQLAVRVFGAAAVVAVAGSDDKLAVAAQLGAAHGINYKTTPDFGARVQVRRLRGNVGGRGGGGGLHGGGPPRPHGARASRTAASSPCRPPRLQEVTGHKGATLILDPVGGSFWKQNAEALAMGEWKVECRAHLESPLVPLQRYKPLPPTSCATLASVQTAAGSCSARWAASEWTARCSPRCAPLRRRTIAAGHASFHATSHRASSPPVLSPRVQILRKRATLTGTTLRNRSDAYKAALVASFAADAMPLLSSGGCTPTTGQWFGYVVATGAGRGAWWTSPMCWRCNFCALVHSITHTGPTRRSGLASLCRRSAAHHRPRVPAERDPRGARVHGEQREHRQGHHRRQRRRVGRVTVTL